MCKVKFLGSGAIGCVYAIDRKENRKWDFQAPDGSPLASIVLKYNKSGKGIATKEVEALKRVSLGLS